MRQVSESLNEVKDLYKKVLGKPAPEIAPGNYVAFPPGVNPVDFAIQEVRQLKLLSEQAALAPLPVSWVPRADSYALEDAYVVRIDVPGVAQEDLKVFVAGGECVVRGERKPPKDAAEMQPLALERPWGSFERRLMLPPGSDPERVKAHCADGVLEVRVAVEKGGIPKAMKVELA